MGVAWLGSLGLVVLGSNARPQPRLSHCTTEATYRHTDSHGPNLRHRHVNPHLPPLRPCCCLHPDAAWIVLSTLLEPLLHPQWDSCGGDSGTLGDSDLHCLHVVRLRMQPRCRDLVQCHLSLNKLPALSDASLLALRAHCAASLRLNTTSDAAGSDAMTTERTARGCQGPYCAPTWKVFFCEILERMLRSLTG